MKKITLLAAAAVAMLGGNADAQAEFDFAHGGSYHLISLDEAPLAGDGNAAALVSDCRPSEKPRFISSWGHT